MTTINQMMEELPEELKEAADALTEKQLEVANLHLRKTSQRSIIRQAGLSTGRPIADLANLRNMLNNGFVRDYINLFKDYMVSKTVADLELIDQQLRDIVLTDVTEILEYRTVPVYEDVFPDYNDPDYDPDMDDGEPERVLVGYRNIPYLRPLEELTPRQRSMILDVRQGKSGLEYTFEDKMKARDMIIRRHGGYTDNINSNLTGKVESTVHVFAHVPNNKRGPRDQKD